MTENSADKPLGEATRGPVGVKGWLLTYVLFSTVVYPVAMLANVFPLSSFAKFGPLFGFLAVFSVVLLVAGVYTGTMLIKGKAQGPKGAKVFLAMLIAYSVLLLIAPSTAKSYSSGIMTYSFRVKPEFYTQRWVGLASQLLWLAYFIKSRRVRNTYPAPAPVNPPPAGPAAEGSP